MLLAESVPTFQENNSYPQNSPHFIVHNMITWLQRMNRKYIEHKAILNKVGVLLAKVLIIFIYMYISYAFLYVSIFYIYDN